MKAILLREFGGPDVLHLEEVATPSPAPGEVLIQVRSVSVNPPLAPFGPAGKSPAAANLPLAPGVAPAGVVAAVGAGVTTHPIGARVAVVSMIACGACDYC